MGVVVSGRRWWIVGAVVVATFGYTVEVRRSDASVLSYGHHEWLTAHTLKFARIWWHEGALNHDLLMIETPRDIEHLTVESQQVYASYPPAAVLAPYLVARLRGVEPTVGFVMAFNRALHLFIALCLSLAVLLCIDYGQHEIVRLLSAVVPGIAYLLLPGPMFWQQNVYFTDTAVMAPFALLLFALAMENVVRRPWPQVLVAFAFLWGCATDWFFGSVGLVWGAVRLAGLFASKRAPADAALTLPRRLFREFALPSMAALLAFGFYAWQLSRHSLWKTVRAKLDLRTFGTDDGAESLNSKFNDVVWGHISEQYGQVGRVLLFVIFGFAVIHLIWTLLLRWKSQRPENSVWSLRVTTFISVATLSPLLHMYLLQNHSYHHDFSALKFAVPLACVPFVLMPQIVASTLSTHRALGRSLIVAAACLGLVYTQRMHVRYRGMVPARNPEIARMGAFVSREARFEDVVFSDFVSAEPYPGEPHLMAHTLKMIHRVANTDQLAAAVKALPAQANVTWFGNIEHAAEPMGGEELWAGAERISEGPLYFARLTREVFLRHLQVDRNVVAE